MILGTLDAIADQIKLTPELQKALGFLRQPGLSDLPVGRADIDGTAVYALVQAYETLPVGEVIRCEAHRQYLDIQYIAEGIEVMGYVPIRALLEPTAYNPEKDVWHGMVAAGQAALVRVGAGQAAVFFPTDAHAPKLASGAPAPVKKVVVKVRVG